MKKHFILQDHNEIMEEHVNQDEKQISDLYGSQKGKTRTMTTAERDALARKLYP